MKQLLVTGGGGFLGTEIIKQLVAKYSTQYEILCLGRNIYPEVQALGATCLKIDLCNLGEVSKLDLSKVDAVFHVAALAGVWGKYQDFYNVNYLGSKNISDHAKAQGVRIFIYTSTPSVVIGKEDILLGDETTPFPNKYLTAYAETKAMAENYIHALNSKEFQTVALRPHLIWGPGDPHLIPRVVASAKLGKLKQVGEGQNMVDIIHVKNAAHGHIKAFETIQQGSNIGGNSYFIGQERPVNLWEFINQVLIAKKLKPIDSQISFAFAYILGAVLEGCYKLLGIYRPEPPMTRFVALQLAKSHYFSHEKASKDFGYKPILSIEAGMEQTFK